MFLSLRLTKAALWKCSLLQLVRSCGGHAAPWLYSSEANIDDGSSIREDHRYVICTSVVLQMLTGPAKHDHVQYELFKKFKQFLLYYVCYV